jgi:hypothetical protein
MSSPTPEPTHYIEVNDDISPYGKGGDLAPLLYVLGGAVGVIGLAVGGCYYAGACSSDAAIAVVPEHVVDL